MRALATAAISLVVLVGCSQQAEEYDRAADVVNALRDGGMPCTDLTSEGDAKLVTERASCSLSDTPVGIYMFEDTDDRDAWLQVGTGLGDVVVGPNWALDVADDDLAREVGDMLGGEVR